MDKYDKLGEEGVRQLLGKGRKDSSGDFTKGAGMSEAQANVVIEFLKNTVHSNPGSAVLPRDNPELKEMKGGVLVKNPDTLTFNKVNLYEHPLAQEALHLFDRSVSLGFDWRVT